MVQGAKSQQASQPASLPDRLQLYQNNRTDACANTIEMLSSLQATVVLQPVANESRGWVCLPERHHQPACPPKRRCSPSHDAPGRRLPLSPSSLLMPGL